MCLLFNIKLQFMISFLANPDPFIQETPKPFGKNIN